MKKPENSIRIITLNTWKGDGLYDWRLQLMARELYSLMPDVLCLQEAVRSDDFQIDTADFLADFLDMEKVYAPARWKSRKIGSYEYNCTSGLAILSAYDVDKHWTDNLPVVPEDPERIACTAQIQVDHHLLSITNLHLTHLPDADRLRCEQLISVMRQNSGLEDTSIWLCCGDFNLSLSEELLSSIAQQTSQQIIDCYLAGHGSLPGATLVKSNRSSSNSRIDHILILQGRDQTPPRINNSRVVLDEPDFEGCYPSDHFGVCVDINLNID